MGKRCIICSSEAQYVVKGTADYYCQKDAEEFFGDLALLQHVAEQAEELKKLINERLEDDTGQVADKD